MEIGSKIRNLRLKMGLTQEELAERSDLTKGFISQVERDHSSPSVDTLDAIVRALGSNLTEFFRETAREPVVYPASRAVVLRDGERGNAMHFLVSNAQQLDMEPVLVELSPGGRSRTYSPYEGQVFGFVLAGSIRLHLDAEIFPVNAADSFYFSADRRFFVENQGPVDAQLLWILSPPNF